MNNSCPYLNGDLSDIGQVSGCSAIKCMKINFL